MNEHKHRCKSCRTVWQHSDGCVLLTEADFNEVHSCPKCGRSETNKYFGKREATHRDVVKKLPKRQWGYLMGIHLVLAFRFVKRCFVVSPA